MNSKQLGSFKLDEFLVRKNPEIVAAAFQDMQFVAVRTETLFCSQKIEYTGISNKFKEVSIAAIIPEYSVDIIMKRVEPVMEVNPFAEEYSHVEVELLSDLPKQSSDEVSGD